MDIVKKALILAGFCVVAAALLAWVYLATEPQIRLNASLVLQQAEQEVLNGVAGRAIQVSSPGYAGPVDLLVGLDQRGSVTGVKILNQRETPGLGQKISQPVFLQQFIGRSAKDRLEPKQDIDAITGATISSRAVCLGVKKALQKVRP
jgi:electron transport complex protein RnfG